MANISFLESLLSKPSTVCAAFFLGLIYSIGSEKSDEIVNTAVLTALMTVLWIYVNSQIVKHRDEENAKRQDAKDAKNKLKFFTPPSTPDENRKPFVKAFRHGMTPQGFLKK